MFFSLHSIGAQLMSMWIDSCKYDNSELSGFSFLCNALKRWLCPAHNASSIYITLYILHMISIAISVLNQTCLGLILSG